MSTVHQNTTAVKGEGSLPVDSNAVKVEDTSLEDVKHDSPAAVSPSETAVASSSSAQDLSHSDNGKAEPPEAANGTTIPDRIDLLVVSTNLQARQKFISDQRKDTIQKLAQNCKKTRDGKADPRKMSSPEAQGQIQRLDRLLTWMELELQITPRIKTNTLIDQGIRLIYADDRFDFPGTFPDRARALFEKWEEENWGADPVDEEPEDEASGESDSNNRGDGPRPAQRRRITRDDEDEEPRVTSVRLPPLNHPIWGKGGIMYGMALKKGQRRIYIPNPQLQMKKGSFKIYGANGFKNGDWFPFQQVALFRGVHGSAMGGISGDKVTGAYSVVISGGYAELDRDLGDTIYYSGSGSHENTNAGAPAKSTTATMCLHASYDHGRPVRVLRSAKGHSRFAPAVGMRYDGLYTVVELLWPKNSLGGVYEQFKLVRREGQPPIQAQTRPTAAEVRDFDEIEKGY